MKISDLKIGDILRAKPAYVCPERLDIVVIVDKDHAHTMTGRIVTQDELDYEERCGNLLDIKTPEQPAAAQKRGATDERRQG